MRLPYIDQAVTKRRSRSGIKASVETIHWPEPKEKTENFETQARTHRFRALGKACSQRGLRYILFGHHANDQVETVLGRIVTGYTNSGLIGIKPEGHIPCCENQWGVSEGPHNFRHAHENVHSESRLYLDHWNEGTSHTSIAGPGITVHRPFLCFPKARLLATCEQNGTPWVEDETNQDISLTERNTLRYLLAQKRLPTALRERNLLRLAKVYEQRFTGDELEKRTAFDALDFEYIDLYGGAMSFRIAVDDILATDEDQDTNSGMVEQRMPKQLKHLIVQCYWMLSQGVDLQWRMVYGIVSKVVYSLKQEKSDLTFAAGGLKWHIVSDASTTGMSHWTLTRESPYSKQVPQPRSWSRLSAESAPQMQATEQQDPMPFGTWYLFDSRYWINVHDHKTEFVMVRAVDHGDVRYFRDRFRAKPKVLELLDRAIPRKRNGQVKIVLPGLARDEFGPIVALPTLGLVTPEARDQLSWDMCYRSVDLGRHIDKLSGLRA